MEEPNQTNPSLNSLGAIPSMPAAPTPAVNTDPSSEWPKKNSGKKRMWKVFGGIMALLLVAGVAVGSFYFTRNLNRAEVPTNPSSEPMAAPRVTPCTTYDQDICAITEGDTTTICPRGSYACGPAKSECCKVDPNGGGKTGNDKGGSGGPSCPSGYKSNGACEAGLRPLTVANCCVLSTGLSCPAGYVSNGRCEAGNTDISRDNCCVLSTVTGTVTGTVTSAITQPPATGGGSGDGVGGGNGSGGSCGKKYFFAISTQEVAGVNQGSCKLTTETYRSDMTSCLYAGQTCSENLKKVLPKELWGTATCYNSLSECNGAGGNTGIRYYYDVKIKSCRSTNHRYTAAGVDVDNTGRDCAANLRFWDKVKSPYDVCYTTMLSCQNAQSCRVTSWTPAANTVCPGTNVTQTSNCGTTRVVNGTKATGCDSTAEDADLSMEKRAYRDESTNKAGDYKLSHEIDTVSKDQTFVYAFEITNSGTGTANNIVLVDTLKGDNQELLTLVDAEAACKYTSSSRKVTCSGMDLKPDETGTYSFRVKVSSGAVNGETIKNLGTATYDEMPTDGEIEASAEVAISTVVGCNNTCTSDDECVAGLSCDPSTDKCRRPSCSDSSTCNCPVEPTDEPTAPPARSSAPRTQPTVLPETGILDFPGVAAFGGGLLLTIVGILLAL